MNKKDFNTEGFEEYTKKVELLYQKQEQLKEEYINKNTKYKAGDYVVVYNNEKMIVVIIEKFLIRCNGSIEPTFLKPIDKTRLFNDNFKISHLVK